MSPKSGDVAPAGPADDDQRRTYAEFTLEPEGSARLRVTETGFAQLPLDTRTETYKSHSETGIAPEHVARLPEPQRQASFGPRKPVPRLTRDGRAIARRDLWPPQIERWFWPAMFWSGRRDLNPRPQRPERCALTKLRYFPVGRRA